MFKRYCQAQKLRAGLLDGEAERMPFLKDLRSSFRTLFDGERRGTLMSDILESSGALYAGDYIPDPKAREKSLSEAVFEGLKDWFQTQPWQPQSVSNFASIWSSLTANGATYKPASISPRDSYVLIGLGSTPGLGAPSDWKAAQIISIFQQVYRDTNLGGSSKDERNFVLCEIKYYRGLTEQDRGFDCYRKYPIAGGRIYYHDQEPGSKIVLASQIICHFARTRGVSPNISKPHIHVLPLDRVSRCLVLPK